MLSVKAAAQRAGVSEGIVRGWLADGSLPHFRLGSTGRRGKIVIDQQDLDAFLASRKVGGRVTTPDPLPTKTAAKSVTLKHLRMPS